MPTFVGPDASLLAYRVEGSGPPLIVLPGGPGKAPAYLGDLGGLGAHRTLHVLELRGTGGSAIPADPASYRCDRQVDDVEALRAQLGLEHADVLGHCAGANLAIQYAARYPERLRRLALITPSLRALGIDNPFDQRQLAAEARAGEPWYPEAKAAFDSIIAGSATAESWRAVAPFTYGRWDAAAQAHAAADDAEPLNQAAEDGFFADGAFDPAATKAALAALTAPVLQLAGELDGGPRPRLVEETAGLFPKGEAAVVSGGGHFPWLDDAEGFAQVVTRFLA